MSCCTPDAARPTTIATTTATATTTYTVAGMSCGHCRTAVTEAVGALVDVTSVDVDVPGGLVTVTTGGAPDDTAIAAAIDDAGYTLTGRA
ncbi:cation transporter [Streptomyces sp. NPDC048338]|uniref:cation transporter n=1 Tax=Streptomyces sp. NPDC048338 TaxID=3365536 RepID=UPI0037139869